MNPVAQTKNGSVWGHRAAKQTAKQAISEKKYSTLALKNIITPIIAGSIIGFAIGIALSAWGAAV